MRTVFKKEKISSKGVFVKETEWTANAETMQLDLKFKVCSETKNEAVLVKGERFPFTISLIKKGENFALKTCLVIKPTKLNDSSSKLETKGHIEVSCETDSCISQDEWQTISLVVCDSEIDMFVNEELKARRVFSGNVCISKNQETKMTFGGKNFDGYAEYCDTFDTIQTDKQDKIKSADEVGYMEIESKYEDLELDGKNLGDAKAYVTTYDVSHYKSEPRIVEYEYGVISWSQETQAVYCSKELYEYYLNNVKEEEQSYPIVDEKQCKVGSYILFPNELVYRNGSHYTILRGAIYHRYVDEGLENSILGYPNTDYDNYTSHKDIASFQNGVILSFIDAVSGEESTSVMDHDMYSHYKANKEKLGEAGPATIKREKYFKKSSDSVVTIGTSYLDYLYSTVEKIDVLRCKEGDLYRITFSIGIFFSKSERTEYYCIYGDIAQTYREMGDVECKLSFPISSHTYKSTGTEFCDFDNGVISKKNGDIKSYTPMALHLVEASVKKIDDGLDKSPEVKASAYWTVGNNSEKQIYSCGKGKKADSVFNFAKHDTSPNKGVIEFIPSGANDIKVRVRLEDWDRVTKNDEIGKFIFDLNVENDWQLGKQCEMIFTEEGKDNLGGLENGRLSYTVYDVYEEREVRENPIVRRDYYWNFYNFSNKINGEKVKTPYSDYDKTFGISGHDSWFDYVLHQLDNYWYETCIEDCGTGGNCFGMTTEAIHSISGYSLYHPSLSKYLPNPDYRLGESNNYIDFKGDAGEKLRNTINCKHLYQFGAAVIKKRISIGIDNHTTKENFDTIKEYINKDGYVLISLSGTQDGDFFGHAVLGYKVGQDGNGNDIIYTADSNYPYGRNTIEDYTFLRYKANKDVEYVFERNNTEHEAYNGLKLGLVIAIPMSVCLQYPKVPNLAVMLKWESYKSKRMVFLNLDCCCKSIVRDQEELYSSEKGIISNDVIPLTNEGGKLLAFIKGKTNNLSIKSFGKKSGRKNRISLISKAGTYIVEAKEEEGVEDAVVFTKLEQRIPTLELSSATNKKFEVNINSTRKVGKEFQIYTGKHQLLKNSVKIQENPFAGRLDFVEENNSHFKKVKRLVFKSKKHKDETENSPMRDLRNIKIKDLLPKYTSKKYVRPKKTKATRLIYSKIRIIGFKK